MNGRRGVMIARDSLLPDRHRFRAVPIALLIAVLIPSGAHARVTRVIVDTTRSQSPAFGGKTFGAGLQYERIVGEVYGELDPLDPRNAIIQDIDLAPKDAHGMVDYEATFTLIKPVDMAKASGVLLYEVVNRGASILPKDLSSGDVFLASGWQGDIPFGGKSIYGLPGETIRVPVARHADGSPVTGPVLARFSNMAPGLNTLPLRAAQGYASSGAAPVPVDLDTAHATLTTRSFESVNGASGPVATISSRAWAWADCGSTPFPGKPDPAKICLRSGFNPDLMYQLVYQGKDPLVLGIGLAAIRDVSSFFRYAQRDDAGWQNPLAGHVRFAIGEGASQSGNLIRTWLNLGFNQDESGRRVWDGAMPTIAARQTPINYRFAIPGGASNLYELGSDGVLWWSDWPDPARHQPGAGLLDRCRASHTCPKIVEVYGSSEFWSLRVSPDFVGTDDAKDIPLPPNVRRYYIASTQHGGGRGGEFHAGPVPLAPPQIEMVRPGAPRDPIMGTTCAFPMNPNPESNIDKALLVDLQAWVVKGTPPPPSQYPTLAAGQLVPANSHAMGFPQIPGVPDPDGIANPLLVYDLGPDFHANDLSGVLDHEPPPIVKIIPPLVPRVDRDGNEAGGIHTVLQQAALGTYLGWNLTAAGYTKGQYCSLWGSFIPFARTRAERIAAHDPRLSLEERYGTQEGYVCVVRQAAHKLVSWRLLLQDDADRIIREAADAHILPNNASSSAADEQTAAHLCAGHPLAP